MRKLNLRVLGVMTGTSCDGLDAACVEIDLNGWHRLWTHSTPYPKSLKKSVLSFQESNIPHSITDWLKLDRDLGNWYGSTIQSIIKAHNQRPEVIANHGQTVAHVPGKPFQSMTLQMGDSSRIASATGISVISHFREGDIAAGGQGAPLSPLFHQMLARTLSKRRSGVAIHNIGGISNLTYLGPKGKLIAFDTGPGNIWIDAAVEKMTHRRLHMDAEGRFSAEGQVDHKAIREILRHPYFSKPIPKSTGRSEFSSDYFFSKTTAKGKSLVATATEVTVESIASAYRTWILDQGLPLREIFVCGGGVKNLTLMRGLQSRLPEAKILNLSEKGFDSQFIEAQAFAIFGFLSLLGQSLGGPWTGSHKFGPPAHIIPGRNWKEVVIKTSKLLECQTNFHHNQFHFE